MTSRLRISTVLLAFAVFVSLAVVFHPHAEEVDDSEPASVSESDMQLYIKVYGAMQADHDLTIENAVKPHQLTLDDFRRLERRIQKQPRLVDRVRQALLDQVRASSTFAQSTATPTPAGMVVPRKSDGRKKR